MKIFQAMAATFWAAAGPALGCQDSLVGKYDAMKPSGEVVEVLWLKLVDGELQAYFNAAPSWYLSQQKPQEVPPEQFAAIPGPPTLPPICVIAIDGGFFAQVPRGWSMGPSIIESGYAFITLGGAHELWKGDP